MTILERTGVDSKLALKQFELDALGHALQRFTAIAPMNGAPLVRFP